MAIMDDVERILSSNKQARSDDKLLLLLYWEQVDGINLSNIRNEFHNTTATETIIRYRRKLQEQGRYLPNEEVLRLRKLRQKEVRNTIVHV